MRPGIRFNGCGDEFLGESRWCVLSEICSCRSPMLPNFIGIGAPKAATTWLAQRLRDHPNVFLTPVKETHFFTQDVVDGHLDQYESYFEDVERESAVGEISVDYYRSDIVPRRVHRYLPKVRLFASLRNPIDQAYSYYWHFQRQNFHNEGHAENFEEALEVFPDRFIQAGLHYQNLSRWLEYFDRSQILILFFEDVKEKPEQTLERLYKHIGVDPSVAARVASRREDQARSGTSPRGPVAERVRQGLHGFLTQHVYNPLKNLIGVPQATKVKNALRLRKIMEWAFRRDGYPDMSPETRSALRDRFASDIDRLEKLTGRDLSHWQ